METSSKKRKPRHTKPVTWYADGLRFTCQQCGECCGGAPGFVWVTQGEMRKISEFLNLTCEAFSRKYLRRTGSGFSLIENPNGDCVFYEENGCLIYPVRPVQCSTWPFWPSNLVSPETWQECCSACPGSGTGRRHTYSDIQRALMKHRRDL